MFNLMIKKIKIYFAKKCRPYYCIIFGRRTDTHRSLRYFCRFICGLSFAYLFWIFFLLTFSLSSDSLHTILYTLIGIVGIGFIFSKSIRCVTFLIFFGMLGKSGRSYLRALSFAFIISGPIANLAENGAEIVRVFACTTSLTYNLTKTRFDLMTKPFQNTLKAMKGDVKEVQNAFADIRNVLEPMRIEVEGDELEPNKEIFEIDKSTIKIDDKNFTNLQRNNSNFVDQANSSLTDVNFKDSKNVFNAQNNKNKTFVGFKNATNNSKNTPMNNPKTSEATSNNQKEINATFGKIGSKNATFLNQKDKNATFIKSNIDSKNATNNNSKLTTKIRKSKKNYKKQRYKRRHHRQSSAERAAEIQEKYAKKFERRCKLQLSKGEQRCKDVFKKAHDRCENKFPFIVRSLLCWPFHLDVICNFKILGNPDTICDPTEALPNNFGESYQELEEVEEQLYKGDKDLEVNYKIQHMKTPPGLKNAEETAKLMMNDLKRKKTSFDYAMGIMQKFLSFLFIRVIFASMSYRKKYNREIKFDNVYISEYFKHVDKRRKLERKAAVLPLRKYEKKNLVDTSKPCVHTKEESRAITFHLLQFLLELITAIIFLLLDYFIITLLKIVRSRSQISYIQEGEHIIKFHITGTGLMARLMRTTLKNFNMHEKVNTFLTNEICLPQPNILPDSFYWKLASLYLGITLLIYNSSILMRFRRLICAYFYRKREKERILYLFNSLLRQRHYLFKSMLQIALENVAKIRIRRDINFLLLWQRERSEDFQRNANLKFSAIFYVIGALHCCFEELQKSFRCAPFPFGKYIEFVGRIVIKNHLLVDAHLRLGAIDYDCKATYILEVTQIKLFQKLRLRYPRCFNWLKFFKFARRKCIICEDFEDDNFTECSNPQCIFVYCQDCWKEMGLFCLICSYPIKKINIINFDKFFEIYIEK